jgi:WhiB family redox-sensing transcriptional regulator
MAGDQWRLRAACRGKSLKIFFGDSKREVKQARAFCNACPVKADCLAFAVCLDGSEAHGMFGGLTGRERTMQRLAARQKEAA